MKKNCIPEICKMLGLEIDEEFKIRGDNKIYKFSDDDLLQLVDEIDSIKGFYINANTLILKSIVAGDAEVIKLPWKPKIGDIYWTYVGEEFEIVWNKYSTDAVSCARQKSGMVFKTKEEALKARPKIYKEFTGDEWIDE